MTLVGGGGYAEYAVAYASHLMAIPEAMSFEEAACVCESYITAFLNVFILGELKNKQTAILRWRRRCEYGSDPVIGKALVPESKLIVTVSPEKHDRVQQLGADST